MIEKTSYENSIPDYDELLKKNKKVCYDISFELEVGILLRKNIRVGLSRVVYEIKQMDSNFEAHFDEFTGFLSSTFIFYAKGDDRVKEICLSIKEWAN